MRVALGVSYRGVTYEGWQSQPSGNTVQDVLERALSSFAAETVRTVSAGRTDAGVHAINQVVHFDCMAARTEDGWVRGGNRFLPFDVAVQWSRVVPVSFHARGRALGRRYTYMLRESRARPALEAGLVGWSFRPLDGMRLQAAADRLLGEHDFSAFRSSECQARSPIKTLRKIAVSQRGPYWRFDFDANAFLHHMVRNIVGSLVAVGSGKRDVDWLSQVLAARDRRLAAATFAAAGLYFDGPYYDAADAIPEPLATEPWWP